MGMLQRVMQAVTSKTAKMALGTSALFGLGAQAHAALPAEITGVFDTANTNATDIGWIVLGLIAAIMAFKFIRRAL